jgi:hypothetical protein
MCRIRRLRGPAPASPAGWPARWRACSARRSTSGFLIGGYTGPRLARRLPAGALRLFVALCGLALAVKLGLSAYR